MKDWRNWVSATCLLVLALLLWVDLQPEVREGMQRWSQRDRHDYEHGRTAVCGLLLMGFLLPQILRPAAMPTGEEPK